MTHIRYDTAPALIVSVKGACRKAERVMVTHEVSDPPILLTSKQVAARLGVSYSTVRRWRTRADFPKPFHYGGVQRWRAADVDVFVAAHLQDAEVAR